MKRAVERETQYGVRSSCCGLWSWGDAPLVDAATHEARRKAHEAFDQVWKSGKHTRSEAYRLLARRLNLPMARCHIKLMNAETAARVIGVAAELNGKQ
ncbi:zinc-finger-containing protein [Bradyrhizobium liaoningense]|uniref:zinc-finger-containing protein n=1 Tax=Bradyrhizobium liaoningense TaxID=43992 RepID=UPI0004BBB3E4|nr:zinc-finger-containing protein [Bradyrhizobium liaoningense]